MDAAMRRLALIKERVDLVLDRYKMERGCPCDFRQFIYWAGKEQGPGWQDNLQNCLVRAALELDCFEKSEFREKEWVHAGSWFCRNCGTLWRHISIEWRMLAFQERLLRLGEEDPESLCEGMIAKDVAATVGHEPVDRISLTLDQWVEFMLGRDRKPLTGESTRRERGAVDRP